MLLTSDIGQVFISIGVVAFCVLLFVGTYLLNKKTKKPEGCETLNCEGCSIANCSHQPDKNKEKGEKEND